MKSQKWKDLMSFSAREKRGISVLIIVILVLIILRVWAPWKNTDRQVYDFSGYEADIDKFEMQLTKETQNHYTFSDKKSGSVQKPDYINTLFDFDPNIVSVKEMISLGFSEKLAHNIISYREAGGTFYSAKDLKKIYTMPEKFYLHIKPYVTIQTEKNKYNKEHEIFHFDPNKISSDSLKLLGFAPDIAERWIKYRNAAGGFKNLDGIKKLYGIDTALLNQLEPDMHFHADDKNEDTVDEKIIPVQINITDIKELIKTGAVKEHLAQRIIAYRDLLGGFYETDQLLEVYGLKQEDLNKLNKHLIIDDNNLTYIDLNNISFGDLLSHPYMTKNNVKNIMQYRDFAGNIKNTKELLKNKIIPDSTYQKILPYLHSQ